MSYLVPAGLWAKKWPSQAKNKVIETAITSKADYIVSGDKDLPEFLAGLQL